MKRIHIETARLLIRAFIPDDAQGLHAILGDGETMKHYEPAYDFEKTERFLQQFCISQQGAVGAFHLETGNLIGYILFHEYAPGVYEMGWIFNRAYWRRGYAFEACSAVMNHAFANLEAHKVFAETIAPVRSVGLMRKLGMRCEGIQRSQTLDHEGCRTELHLYGILKNEW